MKKNIRTVLPLLVVALMFMVIAIPATAGVVFSAAAFNEQCPVCIVGGNTGTAVDMMEVFIEPVAGVVFQNPGLSVYDAGWGVTDWVDSNPNTMYSTAGGSAMNNFNYVINFAIDGTMYPSTVAIGVDVYYFQSQGGIETLIDQAGLTYAGPTSFQTDVNNWQVGGILNQGGLGGENATPEPATMLMIGGGLGLLGLIRHQRKTR